MNDEPDYITIAPAVAHDQYCVMVMKWNRSSDEYSTSRCSQALNRTAADALAKSWAAALNLEIR